MLLPVVLVRGCYDESRVQSPLKNSKAFVLRGMQNLRSDIEVHTFYVQLAVELFNFLSLCILKFSHPILRCCSV
jgi:hypothetical protein